MKKQYGFFKAFRDLFKYSKENKKQYILGTIFMIFFVITSMIYTTKKSPLFKMGFLFCITKKLKRNRRRRFCLLTAGKKL